MWSGLAGVVGNKLREGRLTVCTLTHSLTITLTHSPSLLHYTLTILAYYAYHVRADRRILFSLLCVCVLMYVLVQYMHNGIQDNHTLKKKYYFSHFYTTLESL